MINKLRQQLWVRKNVRAIKRHYLRWPYKVWSEDESKEWCLEEPEALYDFIRFECQ